MPPIPRFTPGRNIPPAGPLIALATGVLLVLAVAGPAVAHAEFVSSDPAAGAVVTTSPTTITLTFSEELDPSLSLFKVSGPAGDVGTGKVGGVVTQMLLPALTLAPGDYTIAWTSVALDKDLLRGTVSFTVAPAASSTLASSAPSAPGGASSAPGSATGTPVATPISSAAGSDTVQAAPGDVVLPIIAALVLVGGIGLYLLRRGRRA